MAELVGIIASVIAIAGLGAKLSKSLYTAGDKAINADHNLNRVASNVALFSGTLKYFATVLQSNERLFSEEAKSVAEDLLLECDDVFRHLATLAVMAQGKAEKKSGYSDGSDLWRGDKKSRRLSVIDKFRAYFEGPKVEVMLASLEYLKSTLQLLIQTLLLAAVTADAKEKQVADAAVPKETVDRIQLERIHVETLIIARQLSINILDQRRKYQQHDEQEGAHLSPAISEESFEGVRHTQMLEAAPAPINALTLGDLRSIPVLDRTVNSGAELRANTSRPTVRPLSHAEIIDQLLGSWTRLSEVEQEIEWSKSGRRDSGRMQDISSDLGSNDSSDARQDSNTADLALAHVQSPENIGNDGAPAMSPKYLLPNTTGDTKTLPQTSLSLPPPPKGPAPSRYTVNGRISLSRSISNQDADMYQRAIVLSQQPSETNMLAIRVPHEPRQIKPNPFKPAQQRIGPAVPLIGSAQPDCPIDHSNSNYRRPQYENVEESVSESSEYEDEESSLKIYWTIRTREAIPRRWDMMDGKVIGPRTPMLPTETVDYLARTLKGGDTVIEGDWVSEAALREGKYEYNSEKGQGEDNFLSAGESKKKYWVISQVLRWSQVDNLVNRTIEIIDARSKAQSMPQNQRQSSSVDGNLASRPRNNQPPVVVTSPSIPIQHQFQPGYSSPQAPYEPNGQMSSRSWAASNERPLPLNGGARPSSFKPPQEYGPRPGTSSSTASAAPRSPRLSADREALYEKNVRFSQLDGPPRSAPPSAAASRLNIPRDGRRRRDNEHDGYRDHYSDGSEAERRERDGRRRRDHRDKEKEGHKTKAHSSRKMAKLLAGVAAGTALLDGLESAMMF